MTQLGAHADLKMFITHTFITNTCTNRHHLTLYWAIIHNLFHDLLFLQEKTERFKVKHETDMKLITSQWNGEDENKLPEH